MLFTQIHKTCQLGSGKKYSWGLATTHAFYSPILLHLIIRSLMTSELTVSGEQQEER